MAPPAKRQKRLVLSSDDELSNNNDPATAGGNVKLKRPSRKKTDTTEAPASIKNGAPKTSRISKRTTSLASTPNSSPEKKKTRVGSEDTVKSKSLHSFFSKASEEQRWQKKKKSVEPQPVEEEVEDIDDSSDDHHGTDSSNVRSRNSNRNLKRRVLSTNTNGIATSHSISQENDSAASITASQKFALPSFKHATSSSQPIGAPMNVDGRPWADHFGPENLEELAVHKKKVTDVRAWIVEALSHAQRRHLLVLKGPAGSGKTTTLHLLCKAMGVRPLEWKNSTTLDGGSSTSFVAHFDDFLNRGGQFGSLEFDITAVQPKPALSKAEEAGRRLLVVDEFPTTFTRSAAALQSFRNSLLRFLSSGSGKINPIFHSSKSELSGSPPLVMIVSETLLSSASASADSFTAHRLLGPEIPNHPCTHIIEFNPIAPTFISKALDIAIKKEARVSKRRRIPGPAIMRRLSEMGDVRSAVNSLEFLCLRGDDAGDWGGRVASKSKKGDKDGMNLTALERESLELVTQRESTLGMFHAVGKVVYNKRDQPQKPSQVPVAPPDHLPQQHRPKISQVVVDDLMNEIGTDISTFISSLHENYVLSCSGAGFVEHLESSIGYLSESDLLDTDSRRSITAYRAGVGSARPTVSTGATDIIRQSEINFDVAVRGLLFALPFPVARATHPTGRKGDSHKMFFPAALRLWKKIEEIEGVLSIWRGKLEQNVSDIASIGADAYKRKLPSDEGRGVSSWKKSNIVTSPSSPSSSKNSDAIPPRFLISRSDLLTDYLPYLSKIHQQQSRTSSHMRPISRGGSTRTPADLSIITQFEGIEASLENEEADDAEEIMTVVPTAGADDNNTVTINKNRIRMVQDPDSVQVLFLEKKKLAELDEEAATREGVEKLYISEDDIEDD